MDTQTVWEQTLAANAGSRHYRLPLRSGSWEGDYVENLLDGILRDQHLDLTWRTVPTHTDPEAPADQVDTPVEYHSDPVVWQLWSQAREGTGLPPGQRARTAPPHRPAEPDGTV